MTGANLTLGVSAVLLVILVLTAVISTIFSCINANQRKALPNVYLGKLSNTDASISDAMEYLKLTNGIGQQKNGDKK